MSDLSALRQAAMNATVGTGFDSMKDAYRAFEDLIYPDVILKLLDEHASMKEALELGDKVIERYVLDCGDNSCHFKARGKGGMRTNGGCRCAENKTRDVGHLAAALISSARSVLASIEGE